MNWTKKSENTLPIGTAISNIAIIISAEGILMHARYQE